MKRFIHISLSLLLLTSSCLTNNRFSDFVLTFLNIFDYTNHTHPEVFVNEYWDVEAKGPYPYCYPSCPTKDRNCVCRSDFSSRKITKHLQKPERYPNGKIKSKTDPTVDQFRIYYSVEGCEQLDEWSKRYNANCKSTLKVVGDSETDGTPDDNFHCYCYF